MTHPVNTAEPVTLAGVPLHQYRHVCAFFSTEAEELRTVVPFSRDGLERGERVVHVMPRRRRDHEDHLRAAALDVDRARRDHQFALLTSEDAYQHNGRFDQDAMLELIQEVLQQGQAMGFRLTRLVAHAEHVLADMRGAEDFIAYESRLNSVLPGYPDVVVCTYDVAEITARAALDVVRTHPMAIVGGVLHENPFFVPPTALLEEARNRPARDGRPDDLHA